ADQRDRDDRADLVAPDVGVRGRGVLEAVVVEVVAGEDRPHLADRPAGDPLAGLRLAGAGDRPEARPVAGYSVVRPVQPAGGLVQDVDPGAVRAQQAGRLVDGQ